MNTPKTCIAGALAVLLAGPGAAPAHVQDGGMMGQGMMGQGMMGQGMCGSRGNGMPGRAPASPPAGATASGSARLFDQTCSRCHALPDPQAHAAAEWPAVVARMQGYMRQAGRAPLSGEQIERLDAFLEQHAAKDR